MENLGEHEQITKLIIAVMLNNITEADETLDVLHNEFKTTPEKLIARMAT